MSKKFKCVYVIDHPRRDLPALIWWASKKQFSSYQNFAIPTTEISFKAINIVKPDAIIWSYARPQNADLIKYSYLKGIKNFIHESEGIPYKCDKDFCHSLDDLTLKSIDGIWCWGAEQELIINNRCKKIGVRNIGINTGSIRYEFYKQLRSKNKKDKILINTNFPIINPKYGSISRDFDIWVNIEKKLTKIEYLQRCIDISAMRENTINFVKNIIERKIIKPNAIILRPHPYEADSYYENLKELGIEISNQRDIAEDISRSIIMVHSGCQTVLDGIIHRVPSILLKPSFENIWSDISPEVDFEKLEYLINNKDEYDKFRDDFIKCSSERVLPYLSNTINKINEKYLFLNLNKKRNLNILHYLNIFLNNQINRFLINLKNIVRNFLYQNENNKKKLSSEIIIKYLNKKNIKFEIYKDKFIYFNK